MNCDLVHCGKEVAIEALISPFRDKEDAPQYHAALNAGVDYFITRNLKDYKYKRTILPVLSPDQFCKLKFD